MRRDLAAGAGVARRGCRIEMRRPPPASATDGDVTEKRGGQESEGSRPAAVRWIPPPVRQMRERYLFRVVTGQAGIPRQWPDIVIDDVLKWICCLDLALTRTVFFCGTGASTSIVRRTSGISWTQDVASLLLLFFFFCRLTVHMHDMNSIILFIFIS